MKLGELKRNVDAAFDRLGDIDCYLDIDPDDEEIYEVESIFIDESIEDSTERGLVFATYTVVPLLKIVK